SQALLDEGAVLTCMSYVDLNPIRASMAETPEESDFTSIQERIKVYIEKQRSDNVSQPRTKLYPFAKTKGNKPLNGIDFAEEDYFRLLDWTGRAIRNDKRGSIPEDLAPILERLNLKPDVWLKSINNYNKDYFTAVGSFEHIKSYAIALKKHWFQGQNAAKNNYCLA
ncbi:MAG: hypothetical protein ABW097_20285, partial [Candidatus Thiodiazotropha lotti]